MKLIQTADELARIQAKLADHIVYICPTYTNQYLHAAAADISLLHLLFDDGEYVCVPHNHPDAHVPGILTFENARRVRALYARDVLATCNVPLDRIDDIAALLYLNRVELPDQSNWYSISMSRLKQHRFKRINLAVPITNWMEFAHDFLVHLASVWTKYPTSPTYDKLRSYILTLNRIEQAGLQVNEPQFLRAFGEDKSSIISNGRVYSEYNPYTATGRPSNAFGGVNFAALNKSDSSRDTFVSRFANGLLVQFDYEAFHLRLLAMLTKFTLPTGSVHHYLAQQYFESADITPEQYDKAKEYTFSVLYGQSENLPDVPFFAAVRKYSADLWNAYVIKGHVLAVHSQRQLIVPTPSENKVLNYLLQSLEMEQSLIQVAELFAYIDRHHLQLRPILYTYDAIVLDIPATEVRHIGKLQQIMESTGFPVRRYVGPTYGTLKLQKN
jgi:hypothetical protein